MKSKMLVSRGKKIIFDVVIIGSGPAGSAAALTLLDSGLSVILMDRVRMPTRKIGESLPPAAQNILDRLGAKNILHECKHFRSYGNISAWGTSDLAHTDFIYDPRGTAWQLDRARFDADLRSTCIRKGAVFFPGWYRSSKRTVHGWVIHGQPDSITARWVVDASGRGGVFARKNGSRRLVDDKLMAIYAWVDANEGDNDTRTVVESCAIGWWYSTLVPHKQRVIALHTWADLAKNIHRDVDKWRSHLENTVHIKQRCLRVKSPTLRFSEACGSSLDRGFGDQWVAVGDAFLSFDPLASQGIFNALYSGMKGAEAIIACESGEPDSLAKYESHLNSIREVYLQRRTLFYNAETRWRLRPHLD